MGFEKFAFNEILWAPQTANDQWNFIYIYLPLQFYLPPPLSRDPGRSRYLEFGYYVFWLILLRAENFSWIFENACFQGETPKTVLILEIFAPAAGWKRHVIMILSNSSIFTSDSRCQGPEKGQRGGGKYERNSTDGCNNIQTKNKSYTFSEMCSI